MLDQYLLSLNFKRCVSDNCVYYNGKVWLVVWVDDLVLFAADMADMDKTKHGLQAKFQMTDLGEAKHILGIRITRDRIRGTISLDQTAYILKIVERFNMSSCHPVHTPLDASPPTHEDCPVTEEDKRAMMDKPFRQAVGSLMYAMLGSRPHIAKAVQVVSQFGNNPGIRHWKATKRILAYLKTTAHSKLVSYRSKSSNISGFCDSDFNGNDKTYRATSGYLFMIAGGAISWAARKQTKVTTSSTQAEYSAAFEAAKEAIWYRHLLSEVDKELIHPLPMWSDSRGSIALMENPCYHKRSKHFDIEHHYLREIVEDRKVIFHHCGTSEMIADIFTKSLPQSKFDKFKALAGLE